MDREYVCYSVVFRDRGKKYDYLARNIDPKVGDYVVVPTRGEYSIAKVVQINKYRESSIPFDFRKLKYIVSVFKKHDMQSDGTSFSKKLAIPTDYDENITVTGLFDCLDQHICEVQDVLSEEQVCHFEHINGIRLPLQYREMLLKVGNGIRIHYRTPNESVFAGEVHIRTVSGIEWERKCETRMDLPFPFTAAYDYQVNPLTLPLFDDCMLEKEPCYKGVCYACDHKGVCLNADYELFVDSLHTPFYNGSLMLTYAGCTYSYHLVLNGLRRGEVWVSDDNVRFIPYAKTFEEYLRKLCSVIMI